MLTPEEPVQKHTVNEILIHGQYATIALSDGNDSYILTLFYGYDPDIETLYFKSSRSGTKFDFLKSNPYVCGTVILQPENELASAYRSVVFRGLVEVIHIPEEKEKALLLIHKHLPFSDRISGTGDQSDSDPNTLIMKLQTDEISAREITL